MRRLPLLLAVLALCACAPAGHTQGRTGAITVKAQTLPMDPTHPSADRIGDFRYAGGLWLTSPDTSLLGGLSDLKVDARGDLTSETDEGSLLRAHIVLDAQGRLLGLDHASIVALTGPDGGPLDGKTEADAEGVAVWPNADLMVSFERNHRIWIYPSKGGPPRAAPMPLVPMPNNEGMEGLTLATSQGPDAYWVGIEGGSIWLCRLAAACEQWRGLPAPPLGYRLTALSETGTGDLVILHHSYNPFSGQSRVRATLVKIPKGPAASGAVEARLEIGPPLTVDNLEGVAVVRSPQGGLRLYLISDDNFSARQRTLLLAFDWMGPGAGRLAPLATR